MKNIEERMKEEIMNIAKALNIDYHYHWAGFKRDEIKNVFAKGYFIEGIFKPNDELIVKISVLSHKEEIYGGKIVIEVRDKDIKSFEFFKEIATFQMMDIREIDMFLIEQARKLIFKLRKKMIM